MRALFDWLVALKPLQRFGLILLVGTMAWSLSSVGYFRLYPLLDVEIGYNDAPLFYAGYYGAWSAVVFFAFHRTFGEYARHHIPYEYIAPSSAMVVVFALFALFVLPRLPAAEWTVAGVTPVEFFWAESQYFLPKSFEILFQQIIVAAMVVALSRMGFTCARIGLLVAVMFGGFHLTLALSYDDLHYVLRYTLAATLFGAILPYILLNLRGGFMITYAIHWGFYAFDITVTHLVFASDQVALT